MKELWRKRAVQKKEHGRRKTWSPITAAPVLDIVLQAGQVVVGYDGEQSGFSKAFVRLSAM